MSVHAVGDSHRKGERDFGKIEVVAILAQRFVVQPAFRCGMLRVRSRSRCFVLSDRERHADLGPSVAGWAALASNLTSYCWIYPRKVGEQKAHTLLHEHYLSTSRIRFLDHPGDLSETLRLKVLVLQIL